MYKIIKTFLMRSLCLIPLIGHTFIVPLNQTEWYFKYRNILPYYYIFTTILSIIGILYLHLHNSHNR